MEQAAAETLVAATGMVTPAPGGPHVEQVGWGVARQVGRVLAPRCDGPARELLEDVVRLAEAPGFLAYAVFEGRTAVAVALVSLPGRVEDGRAAYVGDVVPDDRPEVRQALLVRALHDVANAGLPWLEATGAPDALRPLGFR